MAHALHDPIRHNAWATTPLLLFGRGLDKQTLNSTVPGTYGTILATLRHMIANEIDFLDRLLGRDPADPWRAVETAGVNMLLEHAALRATTWEEFLAGDEDGKRPLEADEVEANEGNDTIPAGVVVAVVLFHGNEHRAHVCTILGALGHEPPDITPRAYAIASGRMRA